MSKYTKNQIEHAKQQVQLLLASRGMTRKQLSFELGYGSDAVTSWLNGRVQFIRRNGRNVPTPEKTGLLV